MNLALAFRLARRELRGGVRGLRIVLACLALGVAAIAAVGSLRAAIDRGLAEEGGRLLGGDLEIDLGANPVPDALRAWLAAQGARSSEVIMMRALLAAPSGDRQLVELKAVDSAWPLLGTAGFDPAGPPPHAGEVAVERVVLDRLGLAPGARVRIGNTTFTLHAALTEEPDSVSSPLLAPRALITLADVPATGLDAPGALVRHAVRLRLPDGTDPARFAADIRAAFPHDGWRVRDPSAAAPGLARVLEQTGQFMTLVGLTALLVGGIGVANGTRAWLAARGRTLATLRCLGAPAGLVLGVCLIQVLGLALLGTAIGLTLGAALPLAAAWLPAGLLPIAPRVALYPGPLALAAAFGLLTALCFALGPLWRAASVPGAALFRDVAGIPRDADRRIILATTLLALLLAGLTIATTPDRWFALWFCAGAFAALALFRAGGWALTRAAGAAPRPRRAWARLGLGNLHRPGATAPTLVVSVGLGLATLAGVALIQGNLKEQVLAQLPAKAPSFFFIDIQNDQLPVFETLLAATKGVEDVKHVPSLRGRIVAVNGIPAEQVRATPETQWALRGDRGLTYAATPPEGTRITAGAWWPADYRGKPLVSFDAALAAGWGVKLGDTIRVNVLGREIDLTVASLRDVSWRSLGINFALVVSPGLLEGAPHTHIATVRAAPSAHGGLLRTVGDALPNVTGIRVEDVLKSVAEILDQLAVALTATGGITLVSGMLVLAGAVAAGQARRVREAVLLKTLGASRAQVRAAWLVEFGAIGLTAGIVAAIVGSTAAWGVVRFVMRGDFVFLPGRVFATILIALALLLVSGYVGTAAALRARAAVVLRNE